LYRHKNLTNEVNETQQNISGFAKSTNSNLFCINVVLGTKARVTAIKKAVQSARIKSKNLSFQLLCLIVRFPVYPIVFEQYLD